MRYLMLSLLLACGCKTASSPNATVKDDLTPESGAGWQAGQWSQKEFFGCAQSEASCQDLCQGRTATADAAGDLCPPESADGGFACYCSTY